FNGARGVVVDGLAWSRKEARGGVVVVHDEERVRLVTLKGDADDHLAERAAGECVGTAESLGTEEYVDAERASLPDEAVEQEGGMLRNTVVLDEELLKFVNDQERARKRFGAPDAFEARQILNAAPTEKIAAPSQFFIHALKHAQPKFPVAFDGDDPRVRQPAGGVTLKFDALLEVHKVELDLVRTAPQGEVGDQYVKQSGFARAGFAGNEGMLARAFSQSEVLELGRAR